MDYFFDSDNWKPRAKRNAQGQDRFGQKGHRPWGNSAAGPPPNPRANFGQPPPMPGQPFNPFGQGPPHQARQPKFAKPHVSVKDQTKLPFSENPFPPCDYSAMIESRDVPAALNTRVMTLLVSKDKVPIRTTEAVLRKIPYFNNILGKAFHSGTFELPHDNPGAVKQIIDWITKPVNCHDSLMFGRIARICDEWCLMRFVQTCLSGYWNGLREASVSGDEERLFQAVKAWYLPLRKNRLRYVVIHFLVARARKMGTQPPKRVMEDAQLSKEFGRLSSLLELAEGRGQQGFPGYRAHEILRRLVSGTLTMNFLETEFNPLIMGRGDDWLKKHLDL